MSEVFEGVLSSTDVATAGQKLAEISPKAPFATAPLGENLTVTYRSGSRYGVPGAVKVEGLAAAMSMALGSVLQVKYDSRTGYRSAILWNGGQAIAEFGAEDELFVPLDEDGEPVASATLRPRADLKSDEEYETAKNAIELGLDAFGVGTWGTLRRFIANS